MQRPRSALLLRQALSFLGNDRNTMLAEHVPHLGELLSRIARLAAEVRSLAIVLGVLDSGPLSSLRCFGLSLAVADMNAISASLTAFCIGSLVAPSNVNC